jgi:polygalacturonase
MLQRNAAYWQRATNGTTMSHLIRFALLISITLLHFLLRNVSIPWKEAIFFPANDDKWSEPKNIHIDVTDYGVMCDGMNDDTFSMQQIFRTVIPAKRRNYSDAHVIVIVPQNCVVLCGPFSIESIHHVTLQVNGHLQAWDIARNNYTLLGMWPKVEPLITYGNSRDIHGLYYQYQPFIYLNNVSHVRITGNGIIDGFGQPWWDVITSTNQSLINLLAAGRPNLIQIMHSSFIEIDTITLTNSPFWTLHPVLSQYVHIHHISITAPLYSPNVDGIDPEYVHISLLICFIIWVGKCFNNISIRF